MDFILKLDYEIEDRMVLNFSNLFWQMKEKTFFWCQWIYNYSVRILQIAWNGCVWIFFPPVHYDTLLPSTCMYIYGYCNMLTMFWLDHCITFYYIYMNVYWYCIKNGTHVQSSRRVEIMAQTKSTFSSKIFVMVVANV